MNKDEIEALDDRGLATWASGDAQGFADMFADEFVLNDVSLPMPITDKEGAKAYAQAWFTAFPDINVKMTNRVVGEDAAAAQVEFTGSNTGPMQMGEKQIPPTGKSVEGRGSYFIRVKDGKVVEFSAYPDVAGMMMQLGFMPPM